MFKKNSCPKCSEKVKSSYSFCPNCGEKLRENIKKYGMLGKNDFSAGNDEEILGGFTDKILTKMIGSAMSMIEKEMMKSTNQKSPSSNIKLMINGKEISNSGNPKNINKEPIKKLPIEFSQENLNKWASLKKKEPKTKLRRIEDKIIYEIEIPEVDSIKNISILNLENGLEIRAIGKKVGYQKNVNIDLPLTKFSLVNGVLTLELNALADSQIL